MQLVRHPASLGASDVSLQVDAARTEFGQIVVRFELRGAIDRLRIPAPVRYGSRLDDLWKTTCFEAFITSDGTSYLELNVSPSNAWAAYAFADYRSEPEYPRIDAPPIDVDSDSAALIVSVAVDLSEVAILASDGPWRLNLTAVIEETDGTKSYWALAHTDGPPDFHDPACFVLELPAAG